MSCRLWARGGGGGESHIYVLACRGLRSTSGVTMQLDLTAPSVCVCLPSTGGRRLCRPSLILFIWIPGERSQFFRSLQQTLSSETSTAPSTSFDMQPGHRLFVRILLFQREFDSLHVSPWLPSSILTSPKPT